MLKFFRIFILLLLLAGVALGAWRAKTRSVEWNYTLPVNIYPVNADASAVSAEYLRNLKLADLKPIETFMKDEAVRYGRDTRASIEIRMHGEIVNLPPEPPHSANPLEAIWWSLQIRWWSYRNGGSTIWLTRISIFPMKGIFRSKDGWRLRMWSANHKVSTSL